MSRASTSATSRSSSRPERRCGQSRRAARLPEPARGGRRRAGRRPAASTNPERASSCWTPTSARDRSGSSAPYDDPPCRCPLRTEHRRRVIAGVCAGIAQALGVDVTLVRLVFALLALAGGAGIVLYLALWVYGGSAAPCGAACSASSPAAPALHAVGLSDRAVAGIALVARGLAVAWRRGGSFRPEAPLSYAGFALVAHRRGAAARAGGDAPAPLLAPGAVAGGAAPDRGARGSGGSRSSGTPSERRASAARSAPTSPRACTTRCCRRSR